MKKFSRGVVIGKFYPPHRGHRYLIDTAASQCERLTVILCGKPTDSIDPDLRGQWLREIHPAAEVMVIDDRYDANDSQVWAENTIRWLGRAPDVVFTSEDYGDRYSALMGSEHVQVDKARVTVPCSGTAIRTNPWANWDFIEPPVRAHFARRICVLGAESTGTTTMAQALAQHYQTEWVAEYGRELSEQKIARGEYQWSSQDFVDVAVEQCRREDAAARRCNRLLICDTNAFATILWHRRYMGSHSEAVAQIASGRKYDLYLLTGDEIPFVQDGTRDGEHIRHQMHEWFVEALEKQGTPWVLLQGTHEERMREAIRQIESIGSRAIS
jgi:HTH-type transcriptional regulator, transcriptional repressor of NAD biosynthesis genes